MKNYILTLLLTFSLSYANISGVAYFEYEDSFALSRTYFTYKTDISDELSFKFQTDVGKIDDVNTQATGFCSDGTSEDQETCEAITNICDGSSACFWTYAQDVDVDNDNRWMGFLKKAQLDWRVNPNMKISMGMIGMNMLNVQEKTWGNRFLYKSAMDKYGFSATADLGFAISRKDGNVTSSFMLSNGEGYKESKVDDKNKISVQVVLGPTTLKNNDDYNFGLVYSKVEDEKVTGFFSGWVREKIIAGFEYNTKDNGSTTDDLISIYANYDINDELTAFVRMDSFDEDTDTVGGETDVQMLGVIWSPTKGLDICPNMISSDDDDVFKMNFQFKF